MTKQSKAFKTTETSETIAPVVAVAETAVEPKRVNKPTYIDMITTAIKILKDRNGSSRQAIFKYIKATYELDSKTASLYGNAAIRKALVSGVLKIGKNTKLFKVGDKTDDKAKKAKKTATVSDGEKKTVSKKEPAKKAATKVKEGATNTTVLNLAKKLVAKSKALNLSIKVAKAKKAAQVASKEKEAPKKKATKKVALPVEEKAAPKSRVAKSKSEPEPVKKTKAAPKKVAAEDKPAVKKTVARKKADKENEPVQNIKAKKATKATK